MMPRHSRYVPIHVPCSLCSLSGLLPPRRHIDVTACPRKPFHIHSPSETLDHDSVVRGNILDGVQCVKIVRRP